MIDRQPPMWAMRWIGIPFVDGGRSDAGCDCWGLVRLAMMERAGIQLGEYATVSESDYAAVSAAIGEAKSRGEWESIPEGHQNALDVVEMSLPAHHNGRASFLPLHVGLLVSRGWMLHTEQSTGSRLSSIRDKLIFPRILGYWRHRALQ